MNVSTSINQAYNKVETLPVTPVTYKKKKIINLSASKCETKSKLKTSKQNKKF
jgi:hypothetical protein